MSATENLHAGHDALVVIGSSAGGIEALSVLVSTLPPDFPAPIVLAQHLDPQRPSSLAAILERRSALPVVIVSDSTPMVPSTIYVVPSNRHVLIKESNVVLGGDHADRPRPSVDLLLSSAAESYGERLIAVILTGSGSDGAAGAVDVKQAGGTVIIQNPQTAHYPSMPMALPPTAVDHVAELDRIGPLLYDILKRDNLPQPHGKADDALRDILTQVTRQANIDFHPYKPSTILRRIARRMAVTHNQTIRDYGQYLETNPEEIGELVMAFLIKVTEFFRDGEAFAYLRDHILPALIERGRDNGRVLRFWSAGCATGEEPYSLALLLADQLGSELPEWSIRIFATDLDEGAISYARRGLYPRNVLGNLPDEYLTRFFEPLDQGYRIVKSLRQMVIFGQQDLSRGAPFPRIEMVICRNLLIYFKPELQQHVLDLFAYSLHQVNGYLFLGKAETARPSNATFELIDKRWKVYRCISGPTALPRYSGISGIGAAASDRYSGRRRDTALERPVDDQEFTPAQLETGSLRWFNEQILRFLPMGVAVIDRSYHIVTINGVARRLLGVRDAGSEQDFLHTVRGLPYAHVRNAIDSVFRERGARTLAELELDPTSGGNGRYLDLTIALLPVESGVPDLALISVNDVTEPVQNRRRLEAVQAEQKQLVDELSAANRRLSEMNQELQDANEELQAANEEMMLAQEELQATNEEFEATNEELQATNEELETNNEELQATNEELETTNDELLARTHDLQELSKMLENERARLAEMVTLSPLSIMIARGPNLLVEAATPSFARLLDKREALGHPLDALLREVGMDILADLVHEAYQQNSPRQSDRMPRHTRDEAAVSVEHYFVYTIVPTHESAGGVDGVVIYADDVSEQLSREAEERREQLKLMVEHADQVALGLYDVQTTELLQASPRYLDMIERARGYARDAIIGSTWRELSFLTPDEDVVALFKSMLERRVARRLPEVRIRLAGEQRETVWDWSLTPIPFPDGARKDAIQFVLVSAIEITEPVRAREEIQRLDHLKDEFLSLASHELRTPMTTLIGYAQMLERLIQRKAASPEREQRIVRIADMFDKQMKRLDQLIEDLLDVGRLRSGKLTLHKEPIDLAALLEQIIEDARMLSAEHTIRLQRPKSGAPLVVAGDAIRLTQVVMNLIQNAITYAPQSKRIDVRLRRAAAEDSAAEMAQIAVQDYGAGIAPEDRAAIFTRFYQVPRNDRPSRGGMGLGLFICKQIVEQHGGSITVDSVVGKGTTFTVQLPLSNAGGN